MWPWWIVPVYFGLKFVHFVTYPIAVLPFSATCHKDLWGNEPPYSCSSYWCPKIPPYRLKDWPQCPQEKEK
jgi:hypothetical protein